MFAKKFSRLVLYLLVFLLLLQSVDPMHVQANFSNTIEMNVIHTYSSGTLAFNRLARSPQGEIYVAYVKKITEEIEIKKWNGDGWDTVTNVTNTLAMDTTITGPLDLVVDANNHIHIVFLYYDGTGMASTRGVKYGYFNGSSWTFNELEYASDPNGWKNFNYPKLAVDSHGKAHVVYAHTDTNSPRKSYLRYATNQTGSWQIKNLVTVNGSSEGLFFAGIKVDSQDRIHLAYNYGQNYYYTNKQLADSDFSAAVPVLDQVNGGYYFNPIVIDSNDRVHFTYKDDVGKAFLASLEAGTWQIEQVYEKEGWNVYPVDVFVYGATKYFLMFTMNIYDYGYYYFAMAKDGNQTVIGSQIDQSENFDYEGVFLVDPNGNYMFVVQDSGLMELSSLSGTSEAFGITLQDTTPPDPPIISSPSDGAYVNSQRPTYSGTAEAGSTVEVYVDDAAVGTVTADGGGNWTYTQPTDLTEAAHTVKATAKDAAGNTSGYSSAVNLTVDLTAPKISGAIISADNAYVDVTFSEGIYGTDLGSGAIDKDDLVLEFAPGSGGATSVTMSDVRKPDAATVDAASALTGGETTVRVFLDVLGTENGTGTIEIRPADASSIYDRAGNAASELETTGQLT